MITEENKLAVLKLKEEGFSWYKISMILGLDYGHIRYNLCPEYREARKISVRKYNKEHPEVHDRAVKKWRENNPEKDKARKKAWNALNLDRAAVVTSNYRAKKNKATPSWLSGYHREEIEFKYLLSKIVSNLTGIKFHVDHILPIKSTVVCGLHVPWNLQLLPAKENLIKNNKVNGRGSKTK